MGNLDIGAVQHGVLDIGAVQAATSVPPPVVVFVGDDSGLTYSPPVAW